MLSVYSRGKTVHLSKIRSRGPKDKAARVYLELIRGYRPLTSVGDQVLLERKADEL